MSGLPQFAKLRTVEGRNALARGLFARWAGAWLAALVLGCVLTGGQTQLKEHQMQAAVLANLAKFVEWPKSETGDGPVVIGVFGYDPFGSDLEQVLKEVRVKGKAVEVKRAQNITDLLGCQIIYFSARETERVRDIRALMQGKPILTVGEDRRFLDSGGMVNFHMQEKKMRFAINLKSAEEAGLSIHPQVLRLATEVKK